jgi:hypothetical protein
MRTAMTAHVQAHQDSLDLPQTGSHRRIKASAPRTATGEADEIGLAMTDALEHILADELNQRA